MQPDHRYEFHPAILLTDRAINQEASYIFYDENCFIAVSSNCCLTSYHQSHFAYLGLYVVTDGEMARSFKQLAMEIMFGDIYHETALSQTEKRCVVASRTSIERSRFIIAGDDLESFCEKIISYCHTKQMFKESIIRIGIWLYKTPPEFPLAKSKELIQEPAKKLLEPFRRLHSIGGVSIYGQISQSYREKMIMEIRKRPPSLDTVLDSVSKEKAVADGHYKSGGHERALQGYQSVIDKIEVGYEDPEREGEVAYGNQLDERHISPLAYLEIAVRSRLVEICFLVKKYHEARKWARTALFRLGNSSLKIGPEEKQMTAKLYFLEGKIDCQFGKPEISLDNIVAALSFDPGNVEFEVELNRVERMMDEGYFSG